MSVRDSARNMKPAPKIADGSVASGSAKNSERRLVVLRRWSVAWAMLPALTFGLATPFLVGFAANRLRSTKLALAALGWGVATITCWAIAGGSGNQSDLRAGSGNFLVALVIVGATFHTFSLRTAVFRLDTLDHDRRSRRDALRIVRERPREALRLRIGRIDDPSGSRWPDGGLIDVNNTAIPVLRRALNLDTTSTDLLAELRAAGQGFTSTPDLELQLSLAPYLLDPVRNRLVFLPPIRHPWVRPSAISDQTVITSEGRSARIPSGEAHLKVHVASWLWAVAPLLTAGLAAAPTFAFAAVRLKVRRIWWVSGAYLLVTLFLGLADGLALSVNWDAVGLWTLGGLATVHALFLRKDVFEVDIIRSDRLKRQAARRLADADPQEAIRLQIGRVEIPEADRYPDGGLIDMNNVPASALCSATGIDDETARKILSTRKAIWGFRNLNDLSIQLDLAPQLFDAVSDRLIFLPVLQNKSSDDPDSPERAAQPGPT